MESEWTFLPNEVVSAHTTPGLSHGGNTPSNIPSLPKVSGPVPPVPDFSDDQFLLHNLDHQQLQSEFDLDGIDFIVPEDLGANSKAFPPSDFPQNTPALNPRSNRLPVAFQSPILPSQNEKSFNEEHLLHKQRQRRQHSHHSQLQLQHHTQQQQQQHQQQQQQQQQQQHVRPDAVFTPLVSPAVTPRELDVNNNKQPYAAVQTSFEPLTSPALNAQQAQQNSDRRRSLSATFGSEDYSGGNSAKRRTPHLTPNLAAHPGSKMKRSPLLRKVPQLFEALPDSSYENGPKSSETTPMLPPQVKRFVIDGPASGATTPSANIGPGTLMGFTMNRLAELQSNQLSSPSPSLSAVNTKARKLRRDSSSSQWSASKNYSKGGDSSLSETSPVIEAQNGEYSGRREKPATKKASHKLAEQGRRNRMNQAVYELSKLIPPNYHEQVLIPSKATTVELAASYIRDLLDEISELKYQHEQS